MFAEQNVNDVDDLVYQASSYVRQISYLLSHMESRGIDMTGARRALASLEMEVGSAPEKSAEMFRESMKKQANHLFVVNIDPQKKYEVALKTYEMGLVKEALSMFKQIAQTVDPSSHMEVVSCAHESIKLINQHQLSGALSG